MFETSDIHPLKDFNDKPRKHVARLKRTGRPEVLTVNGKPSVVVQDADAYQRMIDTLDRAEAIAGIQRGLDSLHQGNSLPAAAALARKPKA